MLWPTIVVSKCHFFRGGSPEGGRGYEQCCDCDYEMHAHPPPQSHHGLCKVSALPCAVAFGGDGPQQQAHNKPENRGFLGATLGAQNY